jgi:hypothetical protein
MWSSTRGVPSKEKKSFFFLILSQDLHQYPLDEGYQPSSNGSWGWFKILFLILHEIVVLKTERVNCFKWNKVGIGQDWF